MKHPVLYALVAALFVSLAYSASAKPYEFELDETAAMPATEAVPAGEIDHNIMPGVMSDAGDDDVGVAATIVSPNPITVSREPKAEAVKEVKPVAAPKDVVVEKPVEKPAKAVAAKPKVIEPQEIPSIVTENEVSKSPDVTYVTGGIGEDEKQAIEAAKGDYNLQVMSASMNGAFVGDAKVVISQKNGKEMVEMLNVIAGPLLYVRLPAGSYVLDATLGAQKKHQAFTVSRKGAPARIHLGWKVDATLSK